MRYIVVPRRAKHKQVSSANKSLTRTASNGQFPELKPVPLIAWP